MDAEYKKAAEKLLCGITDKRLHEPAIWNDIFSSVRSGKLRLWEINDEILRIKYFCKEKIERASAFTESDKSGVRFDDLNAYFVEAIKNGDKGYFEAFIRAYEPVLQSRAERFVSHYNLSADDTEDIKQILYDNQDDYMSKYKQVIEYFDAVKVALTATPALHTTEIFGEPVYTYSYREAVIDGWLVDHDPPYLINTDFIENDAQFKKGETLAQYDPNTNELLNGAVLDDEMDFDVSEFNRKIVLPDHTRKVLEEVSTYLNPESGEKTLIFAVNDAHADRIVDTLREIYKRFRLSVFHVLQ